MTVAFRPNLAIIRRFNAGRGLADCGRAAALRCLSAVRAWRRHREIGALVGLEDRMLSDMGVTRSDLMSALASPLWVDASRDLADRAAEARHARGASARERRSVAALLDR